jgi:hypothetical protein
MSTNVLKKLGCLLCVLPATLSAVNPPPVHFANVHAFEKGDDVQIEWTNPAEEDIAYYEIERSGNGRNFHAIGKKNPIANNGRPASYDFVDEAPLHGPKYYRVAARQLSGNTFYSQILVVSPRDIHTGFDSYPNPVTGRQFNLVFSNIVPGDYKVELVSAEGRNVYRQLLSVQAASQTNLIVLPSSLIPGIYVLHVYSDQYSGSQHLILR